MKLLSPEWIEVSPHRHGPVVVIMMMMWMMMMWMMMITTRVV
jgi:hypothetical protein